MAPDVIELRLLFQTLAKYGVDRGIFLQRADSCLFEHLVVDADSQTSHRLLQHEHTESLQHGSKASLPGCQRRRMAICAFRYGRGSFHTHRAKRRHGRVGHLCQGRDETDRSYSK